LRDRVPFPHKLGPGGNSVIHRVEQEGVLCKPNAGTRPNPHIPQPGEAGWELRDVQRPQTGLLDVDTEHLQDQCRCNKPSTCTVVDKDDSESMLTRRCCHRANGRQLESPNTHFLNDGPGCLLHLHNQATTETEARNLNAVPQAHCQWQAAHESASEHPGTPGPGPPAHAAPQPEGPRSSPLAGPTQPELPRAHTNDMRTVPFCRAVNASHGKAGCEELAQAGGVREPTAAEDTWSSQFS
jgi:hypothetical protein